MAKDDFEIPDIPDIDGEGGAGGRSGGGRGGGGSRGGSDEGRRRRGWIWFLAGLAVGVAATILAPRYVAPHLPGALGGGRIEVEGRVLEKQREEDRLLLTLDSERGAVLATFRERIPELNLLVSKGDRVTLSMNEFRPFVDRPRLVGVKKGAWAGEVPAVDLEGAADTARPGVPPADTAPPADTGGAGPGAPADTGGAGASGDTAGATPSPDTAGGR